MALVGRPVAKEFRVGKRNTVNNGVVTAFDQDKEQDKKKKRSTRNKATAPWTVGLLGGGRPGSGMSRSKLCPPQQQHRL